MNTYIALLRGINVSGQNIIKMADLKILLSNAGLKNVVTYIQSGNIIFSSEEKNKDVLEQLIANCIKEKYDYQIKVLVLTKLYLKQIFDELPFHKNNNLDTKKLGVTFLNTSTIEENIEKILNLKSDDEQLIFKDKVIYMYCANGFGRTKLTNKNIETKLKVSATSRNWNTITKLVQLSNQQFE